MIGLGSQRGTECNSQRGCSLPGTFFCFDGQLGCFLPVTDKLFGYHLDLFLISFLAIFLAHTFRFHVSNGFVVDAVDRWPSRSAAGNVTDQSLVEGCMHPFLWSVTAWC